jgi:hypothetical protein
VVALERKRTHNAFIRELASNLERTMAGESDQVCLSGREAEPSCACYRDAHHDGWHRCLCDAQWASS